MSVDPNTQSCREIHALTEVPPQLFTPTQPRIRNILWFYFYSSSRLISSTLEGLKQQRETMN